MSAGAAGRVLVTGAAGMLGSELLLCAPGGLEPIGTDRVAAPPGSPAVAAAGFDLTDPRQVERLFTEHGPFSGVLHAAAYTAVDRAEEEPELAQAVNATAPAVLARACRERALRMVLLSTDFVFDGSRREPYREDDEPSPLGVYGRTKLEGERAAREAHPEGVSVVRTQWLYGPRGRHFPGTIAGLAAERETLRVVADQVGSPTSTLELAPALWDVLERGEPVTYHAACAGACTWHELAVATVEILRRHRTLAVREVLPCTSAEYPRPARRPAYSVLSCERLTRLRGRPLAPWRDSLERFWEAEVCEA